MSDNAVLSTEIVAFSSGKGGTGKTSVIAALGYALRYCGHKVLMIDTDRATDGFSLFILGPSGMTQVGDYKPENTFTGILSLFQQTEAINAQPRVVHRLDEKDHGVSYEAIISDTALYGELSPANVSPGSTFAISQGVFQNAVRSLFRRLRADHQYDYILVDTRGGFSFESTDVAALADSFVIVTEATYTNFYQDRNLVDRINAAASDRETKPLLRGIIVNKATDGDEVSFRNALTKEFNVRLEDTWPIMADLEAAKAYKTQKVIYKEAPASRFAFDSLQAFRQLLRIVTSQWPEDRVRRWSELVGKIDVAISAHNKEVEEAANLEAARVARIQTLESEEIDLRRQLGSLSEAHDQERRRQDILISEMKDQSRLRDESHERDRAREQARWQDEKRGQQRQVERLLDECDQARRQLAIAQQGAYELDRKWTEKAKAELESVYAAEKHTLKTRTRYFAIIGFALGVAGYFGLYYFFSIQRTQEEMNLQRKQEQASLQKQVEDVLNKLEQEKTRSYQNWGETTPSPGRQPSPPDTPLPNSMPTPSRSKPSPKA